MAVIRQGKGERKKGIWGIWGKGDLGIWGIMGERGQEERQRETEEKRVCGENRDKLLLSQIPQIPFSQIPLSPSPFPLFGHTLKFSTAKLFRQSMTI
ncbi:hypothetical protein MiSe_57050 [Microseira wollei NIES-4236]|uniref:Uncharacterized protein n=1 Tax=Microseira wollei NIES-4236 TaxID=2530354 RepID=A0AAV3XF81_9CYAN|nr:hypothetical protein MiSe_57050 [Microseira wollei NIES-4236]